MPKILLVEDDNNLREIFQMRLQAEGYTAIVAADGEEGLVTAMKEKPDLIIADVMMPKLSGFEMVESLRATPEMKDSKVIMMTALGQAEDRARGEKLGVVKYLVKSQVTLEDFARVVKEVLGPGSPQDQATSQEVASTANNNKESENSMPDDQTNPTGAPADNGAPATNPISGDSGQQTSAQEQGVVNDQVNDFAGSAPDAGAAPSGDAAAAPSDPAAPASDTSTDAPSVPPASEPAAPADPAAPAGGDQSGTPPTDPMSNAL